MGTPLRGRPPKDFVPMKKRLHSLAKYMLDFTVRNITYLWPFPIKRKFSLFYSVKMDVNQC